MKIFRVQFIEDETFYPIEAYSVYAQDEVEAISKATWRKQTMVQRVYAKKIPPQLARYQKHVNEADKWEILFKRKEVYNNE